MVTVCIYVGSVIASFSGFLHHGLHQELGYNIMDWGYNFPTNIIDVLKDLTSRHPAWPIRECSSNLHRCVVTASQQMLLAASQQMLLAG